MADDSVLHGWMDVYPRGWKRVALGEVCRIRRGASPRPVGDPRYFGGTIPWIKISDATREPGRWIRRTEEHVTEEGKARSVYLQRDTLILSNSGTTGRPKFLDIDGCIHDGWLAFDEFEGINPLFLYYLLSWRTSYLTHVADGSVQKNLNTGLLKGLEIGLPPPSEQDAIAHVLGVLDDKIDLNRRMNETLEAMARAIFKSWFVDFDPVRAKAEGRRPAGMDAETAGLFPDGLEDSPAGPVPRGWRVGGIGEDFNVTMGQSPPGETYNEYGDGMPFFQGRTDFGFRYPSRRVYCTAPSRLAQVGDTLVSVRAPVGDINMAAEICCIGRGVAAVRHSSGSRSFTYYAMRSLKSAFEPFEAEGTVFGSISKGAFSAIPWLLPPVQVVQRFEELAFPLDQAIENNERQSLTLAVLRDALLPKLLSGGVRVAEG